MPRYCCASPENVVERVGGGGGGGALRHIFSDFKPFSPNIFRNGVGDYQHGHDWPLSSQAKQKGGGGKKERKTRKKNGKNK